MHVGILQFCFNCRYFKQCRLRNNMNFHLDKGIKGINLPYNKLTRNSTLKFRYHRRNLCMLENFVPRKSCHYTYFIAYIDRSQLKDKIPLYYGPNVY